MKRMIFVLIFAAGSAFAVDHFPSAMNEVRFPSCYTYGQRDWGAPEKQALPKVEAVADANAAWRLACCYRDGDGVPVDEGRIQAFLRQAAEKGHVKARFALLKIEDDADLDYEKNHYAWFWAMRQLAREGYAPAQSEVASMLLRGIGIDEDRSKALEWLRLAAEGGDEWAREKAQEEKLDVPPVDGEEAALARFLVLAEQGDFAAQRRLALCRLHGFGMNPDPERAWAWFEQAAAGGDGEALYRLASRGKEIDFTLMRAAAEAGNPDALFALVETGIRSGDDVARWFAALLKTDAWDLIHEAAGISLLYTKKPDFERAFACYRIAAKGGYYPSMLALGRMHQRGEGTKRNLKAAYRCFNDASRYTTGEACLELGLCYLHGEGTPRDFETAAERLAVALTAGFYDAERFLLFYANGNWLIDQPAERRYLKTAAEGDAKAMYALAGAYLSGDYAAKDRKAGMLWLRRAATAGDAQAQELLGKYLIAGGREKAGFDWIARAAGNNCIGALITQAACFREGRGAEKDEARAKTLLQQAAARGSVRAMILLYRDTEGAEAEGWLKKIRDAERVSGIVCPCCAFDPKEPETDSVWELPR